jgi:hypothetical protein
MRLKWLITLVSLALLAGCSPSPESTEYEVYSAYVGYVEALIEKAGDSLASCRPLVVHSTTTADVFRTEPEWRKWIAESMPGLDPSTLDDFRKRNFDEAGKVRESTLRDSFKTHLAVRRAGAAELAEITKTGYRLSPSYDGPVVAFSRVGLGKGNTQALLWIYKEFLTSAAAEYWLFDRTPKGWVERGRLSGGIPAFVSERRRR